nr:hypothetical protein [uncultured Desulfobulbus sp.]
MEAMMKISIIKQCIEEDFDGNGPEAFIELIEVFMQEASEEDKQYLNNI